jgi:hypothetical protein
MKLCLIAVLLFLSVPQTIKPDAVVERLSKVETFAFGPTGYAGVTSNGEKDFRTSLGGSSALTDFEKLFAEGTIQAKSYALVGIHRLDSSRFNELSRTVRDSKESVTVMKGCIISHESFTHILKQIESGEYQ